jgi:osmoprotectant transport system ATP-binding protein
VFVTHDIDEAIKMGDRIAILQERSVIAQYDTPEHILSNPASQFVANLIGHGAALKRLNLSRVGDIELEQWPTVGAQDDRAGILAALRASERGSVLLLDSQRRPLRWLGARDVPSDDGALDDAGLPADAMLGLEATLNDALNQMLQSNYAAAVVVDREGAYLGVVEFSAVAKAVQRMRQEAVDSARAAAAGTHPRDVVPA